MSFSSRLKQRRKELGMTQEELASLVNVTKGAIGNYESDVSSPRADILFKMFEALHCDANFLFQDEMKEEQPELHPLLVLYESLPEESKSALMFFAEKLAELERLRSRLNDSEE